MYDEKSNKNAEEEEHEHGVLHELDVFGVEGAVEVASMTEAVVVVFVRTQTYGREDWVKRENSFQIVMVLKGSYGRISAKYWILKQRDAWCNLFSAEILRTMKTSFKSINHDG